MGNTFIELLKSIFTIAAGVAIVSVLVSNKSQTSNVIQSWFSGNSNLLATATSPVTGATVHIDTSYPSQNSFGASSGNSPYGG